MWLVLSLTTSTTEFLEQINLVIKGPTNYTQLIEWQFISISTVRESENEELVEYCNYNPLCVAQLGSYWWSSKERKWRGFFSQNSSQLSFSFTIIIMCSFSERWDIILASITVQSLTIHSIIYDDRCRLKLTEVGNSFGYFLTLIYWFQHLIPSRRCTWCTDTAHARV